MPVMVGMIRFSAACNRATGVKARGGWLDKNSDGPAPGYDVRAER
jgi:hypothetical protein